jgi:Fur family iron response transcriptional regulator
MAACIKRGSLVAELKEQVEEKLRSRSVKPTKQRIEIGMLLFASPRHMSADQIISDLRAAGSRVSKATVYNTLNLFSVQGLTREVSVDPERQFYDSTTTPHHHFYNVDTGELTDIGLDDLQFSQLPELPAGTEAQDIEVIVRVRNQA